MSCPTRLSRLMRRGVGDPLGDVMQEERYQQIEYDNRLLLGRMSEIMKVRGAE